MTIPMMSDAVIQRVEDEVTEVSLRHKLGFLPSDKVKQIYVRCLAHVHAEYTATTRNGLRNPVIFVMIRNQDIDSGFKNVPQIIGVDLNEACAMVEQVKEGSRSDLITRIRPAGTFRVVIMLEFDTRFYVIDIPLPPGS